MLNNQVISTEYVQWRTLILNTTFGEPVEHHPNQVYGMLMDVGMGNEQRQFLGISIYAFNTGEASLKTSIGSGVMNLGDHPQLKGIPQKIVELGQELLPFAFFASSMPFAEAGHVRFHFITTSGIWSYDCGLAELRPGHIFLDVFNQFSRIKFVADRFMDQINSQRRS